MVDVTQRLDDEVKRLDKKYGHKTGGIGSDQYELNVIPTGILALDHALGIGGWPRGEAVEIYGPPDIGKTTVLGFNAIKQAQAQGLLCGIIALEPGFDSQWAEKNGVDPDRVAIARPNNGEDAFNILHEWVTGDLIDCILFDSIGAVLKASEAEEGGKPMQGGQSSLITWGVKRILVPLWKSNKLVIFLNQIRDDMKARHPGVYDSPGGHALKHGVAVRVQLRPGKDTYKDKFGGDDIIVGRQLIAVVKRNKKSEGTNARAVFDFYQRDTKDHSVGVDVVTDVTNTCIKTGVIERAGAYYRHSLFPDSQVQGRKGVEDAVRFAPELLEELRTDVLLSMRSDESETGD